MYKQLLKQTSLYSLGPLLGRMLSLITVPIYTRILSPADYGALDILSYTAVLVTLLMGAALDQAVARFYLDAPNDVERKKIASTVLIYYICAFAFLVPLITPFARDLAHNWLHGQVTKNTVMLVFVFIWFNGIYYIADNQLKYLFLSKQVALCAMGNSLVGVAFSLIFVTHYRLGVFGLFLGQTVGAGIFALVALYLGRRSYALLFHWGVLRRLLRYSLPLIPGSLAYYLMQYVDRFAIQEFISLKEVGIYGIGARLASLINLFLTGFQGAWSPTVFKSFRENEAPEKFRVVFNYFLFIVLVMMLGLSVFGKEILRILTTKTFSQGFVVVPLLVSAAILASVGEYFTYGIRIAQKTHYKLVLNITMLIMNVVLNYFLIPPFGIIGAALATATSFLFLSIVGMVISQKLYYVPYRWRNIVIAGVLAAAFSNGVTLINTPITWQMIIIKIGIMAIVAWVIARLLSVRWDKRLSGWIMNRNDRTSG